MRITPRRPRSAGSTGFVRCGLIGWVEGTLGDDFCILKEYAELSSRALPTHACNTPYTLFLTSPISPLFSPHTKDSNRTH